MHHNCIYCYHIYIYICKTVTALATSQPAQGCPVNMERFFLIAASTRKQVSSVSYLRTHCIIVPCSGEGTPKLGDLACGFVDGHYVSVAHNNTKKSLGDLAYGFVSCHHVSGSHQVEAKCVCVLCMDTQVCVCVHVCAYIYIYIYVYAHDIWGKYPVT